jgi:uncharacterized protein
VYLDTSYLAKFYLNEKESARVEELVLGVDLRQSSVMVFAEFHGVLHRWIREERISRKEAGDVASRFSDHIETGFWELIPVTEAVVRRTSILLLAAPANLFLRTADALHLTTAQEAGEREVWTGDRHMRAAAAYFGLRGRSV